MSEALEAQQKTNPQGDPITSVAVPKSDGKKDPHAEAKRQRIVPPVRATLPAHRKERDSGPGPTAA